MVALEEASTGTEEVGVALGAQGRNVGDGRGVSGWRLSKCRFGLVLCEEKGGGDGAQVSRGVMRRYRMLIGVS